MVELVRNLMAHGDAREEKWRGNWRMEWVPSTLTPPPNMVYPALLKLMRTPRLPAVEWTDVPTDLNGLVRFGERRNLVSARVSSRSARAITQVSSEASVFILMALQRYWNKHVTGMGVDRCGRSPETCHDRGREVPLSYDAVLYRTGRPNEYVKWKILTFHPSRILNH